jgi:hypothetical protein
MPNIGKKLLSKEEFNGLSDLMHEIEKSEVSADMQESYTDNHVWIDIVASESGDEYAIRVHRQRLYDIYNQKVDPFEVYMEAQ